MIRHNQWKFARATAPPKNRPAEKSQFCQKRLAPVAKRKNCTVLHSIARTFPVSHLEGCAGEYFSGFIFVKFLHQRKKAAEGGGDSHEEKNQQKPWLRIEIRIQKVPDSHPDGHGKAHFQADAAESKKLLKGLFILHGAEAPQLSLYFIYFLRGPRQHRQL